MTHVLVIDDEPQIRRMLATTLRNRGFDVSLAHTGRAGLDALATAAVDLVLLDLGLPDLDGVEVLSRLRRTSEAPVIVLSVREHESEKVKALDAGADDYMTKPFGIDELLARMRVTMRRRAPHLEPRVFDDGRLHVDLDRMAVEIDGEPVHLTRLEWRIVEVLAGSPGRLVTRRELLQRVWGPQYQTETNYLRVYLTQIRRKLEAEPSRPRHFITETGVGYRFVP